MIRHCCPVCTHWIDSSDHLVGLTVACKACGERVEVPASSAAHSPHATQPSLALRNPTLKPVGPDEPGDEDPVEAGWHRLQDLSAPWLPKTSVGWLLLSLAVVVGGLATAGLLWWFLG